MRILNGADLASFIKERQARQVRALRQAHGITPKLAIIRTNPDPVVDVYMHLKKRYAEDIGAEVEVCEVAQSKAIAAIKKLNADKSVHGIIVQLPLPEPAETDAILSAVAPSKDVDGLHPRTTFDSATATAIHWLLSGYNINLSGKKIVIVGQGRLVGKPLAAMWQASGLDVTTADITTADIPALVRTADVVVSATGSPGLITSSMLRPGAVVVDAGLATDKNGLVGDVAPDARERTDLTITPQKGGVGPLTVCALFDNLIRAAS
jgi:methylenetetrahydrofolate dehydrogenase (NADP+) / methenyltetrahydrofolate cyclohydrolase